MAAEVLAGGGRSVTIYERMPAPARKFLMAGRGGLNLTHGEPLETFLSRYGETRDYVERAIRSFPPAAVSAWSEGLGERTFIGSSGRVFPSSLKASPLLRAWLKRLDALGVILHRGRCWAGWDGTGALLFVDRAGVAQAERPAATILALGGASWPRLGSDGGWVGILEKAGVEVAPLMPSNTGVEIPWSELFAHEFAGTPLKRIAIAAGSHRARGEAVVTRRGIEGGAIYALSAPLRELLACAHETPASISIDLRPDLGLAHIEGRLAAPRGKQSAATFLRKALSLSPVAIGLLREAAGKALPAQPSELARLIKAVPLTVRGLAGLERAISTAGGVRREAVNDHFMLKARPGVFVAGEMLDWDAPTGGYLLQATLATAVAAATGADAWLSRKGGG